MKRLIEDPDNFDMKHLRDLNYGDDDAYAFGYWKNKLYLSDAGAPHRSMKSQFNLKMPGNEEDARENFRYAGRFWTKGKAISFWTYPDTHQKMEKICNELSKLYFEQNNEKIDIWDDFIIDVIENTKSGKISNKYTPIDYLPRGYTVKNIPVKSYKSSMDRSPEELTKQHVMSPTQKLKLGKQMRAHGFGAEKRFNLSSKYASKVGNTFGKKDIPATLMHQLQRTTDSVIKLKSLVENTIAKVSKDINVKIDIDKTFHAGERQYRHENPISDKDIIDIVGLALPEIANKLIFDEIQMGAYVLIRQLSTNTNIVGALHTGNNEEIDFIVVTVMRKKDFVPKNGTHVIEV